MRKPILSGAVAALLLSVTVAAPLAAQSSDMYQISARRQITGVRTLEADVEYAVGRLHVGAAPSGLLYDTKLVYDAGEFEPQRSWSLSDGAGQLALSLSGLDDSWDLDDLDEFDESELGSLDLGLSREVPTVLSLAVGVAEVDMKLGGVALRRFVYRTVASETKIGFESPNPVRMDRMELAAGAAEFAASELGNARFDVIEFTGAIGDVHLDFTGEWTGSASGELRMGLGTLQLTFPRDLGVRIEKSGFLASFDSNGFESVDGGYQTPNWDSAESQLTLNVRAAFGSIDVDFVN
jgi:hypothetical protein